MPRQHSSSAAASSSSSSVSSTEKPNHLQTSIQQRNASLQMLLHLADASDDKLFAELYSEFVTLQQDFLSLIRSAIDKALNKGDSVQVIPYFQWLKESVSGHFYERECKAFENNYRKAFQIYTTLADRQIKANNLRDQSGPNNVKIYPQTRIGTRVGEYPHGSKNFDRFLSRLQDKRVLVERGNADALFANGSAFYQIAQREMQTSHHKKSRHNFRQAYRCWMIAAAQGNPEAPVKIANLFRSGEYFKKNLKKAYGHYRWAAELGSSQALRILGQRYEMGHDVKPDIQRAIRYYQDAADLGDGVAHFCLGQIDETDNRLTEACARYQQAAKKNVKEAQYRLALAYENINPLPGLEKNIQQAIGCYKSAAKQGHADAQYHLGKLYYQQKSVNSENLDMAINSFKAAAHQGHAEAQYRLGLLSLKKLTQRRGLSLYDAITYFQHAAKSGHAGAQCQLGLLYQKGKGVETNLPLSRNYFISAAQQGHAEAQYCLGSVYLYGHDVQKDLSLALDYFTLAAKSGHAEAQYCLGLFYRDGKSVEKDLSKARHYLSLAASQGHLNANYQLGMSLLDGSAGVIDYDSAYGHFKVAGRYPNSAALYELGQMHELGSVDLTIDYKEAVYCYEAAIKEDENRSDITQLASYQLGKIYEKGGHGVEQDINLANKHYRNAIGLRKGLEALKALASLPSSKTPEFFSSIAASSTQTESFAASSRERETMDDEEQVSAAISTQPSSKSAFNH